MAAMLSALVWSGSLTGPIDVGQAIQHVPMLGAGEMALILFSTILISLVFQPLQLELVRILEGYWNLPWLERWIGDRWREKHRSRRAELTKETHVNRSPSTMEDQARVSAALWTRRLRYPEPARILPTTLGNVLRAAEDRAGQRYGLQTIVVWPRLYPLIPARLSQILVEQRNQLDVSARLCAVLLITSLIYLVVILFEPFGWPVRWLWLWVPLTTLALAWFSYRGAVSTATAYGISIETAFDHHRFDMLTALHRRLPKTHQEEISDNDELSLLLQQGVPLQVPYQHRPSRRKRSGPEAPRARGQKRKVSQRRRAKK